MPLISEQNAKCFYYLMIITLFLSNIFQIHFFGDSYFPTFIQCHTFVALKNYSNNSRNNSPFCYQSNTFLYIFFISKFCNFFFLLWSLSLNFFFVRRNTLIYYVSTTKLKTNFVSPIYKIIRINTRKCV